MSKKNYCPNCGNRLKHYKCHVCGTKLHTGKKLKRVFKRKWKYEEEK